MKKKQQVFHSVALRLTPELKAYVDGLADKNRRSANKQMLVILEDYIARNPPL